MSNAMGRLSSSYFQRLRNGGNMRRVTRASLVALTAGSVGLGIAAPNASAAEDSFRGLKEARQGVTQTYANNTDFYSNVAGYPAGLKPAKKDEIRKDYLMPETRGMEVAKVLFPQSKFNWPGGFTTRDNGSDQTIWNGNDSVKAEDYCTEYPDRCYFIGSIADDNAKAEENAAPSIASSRVIVGAPGGTKVTFTEKLTLARANANATGYTYGVKATPLKGSPAEGIGDVSFTYNKTITNTVTNTSDKEDKAEVVIPSGKRVTLRTIANGQTQGGYLAIMAPDKDPQAAAYKYKRVTLIPSTAFVGFNKAPSPITWDFIDENK